MPPLDAGALLEVVSDGSPAGPNLEFDPDFGALERAAQGKPEQQYGGTIIPAEEPDWKEVERQASALLERTRDLRVLGHLGVARLHLTGLSAYAEVVSMTRQLLDARWEEIHPQLDPEEDNDPTLRANALLSLAHPGTVLRYLRSLPLARSARLGQYSWRDVGIATGAIETPEEGEKPSESVIRSAFLDTDAARLEGLRTAASEAVASATGIPAVFDSRAGYGTGPDFDELIKLLKDIVRTIERYAAPTEQAAEAGEPAAEGEAPVDAAGGAAAGATAGAAPGARRGGVNIASLTEVSNRADALRLLDLVCRYYQRYEPASPLSMLIERAAGLAEKNFLEIVRELAPDGLTQVQNVVGNRE